MNTNGGILVPLPDPHATETTVEIDRDKYKLWQEARAAVEAWQAEANRLRKEIEAEAGDAYAMTVDGRKVITNRPKEQYAEARLIKDYPDLVQHFMVPRVQNVFDMEQFREHHPEVAKQYRVRSFVEVKSI
jgi:hypothetical protein